MVIISLRNTFDFHFEGQLSSNGNPVEYVTSKVCHSFGILVRYIPDLLPSTSPNKLGEESNE